jgi:hypothetical protein
MYEQILPPSLHIHSLALSFAKEHIIDLEAAHTLHQYYPAYRLLYYGNTGILVVNGAVFNSVEPVVWQVSQVVNILVKNKIINQYIQLYHFRLHELELKYQFKDCQPFILNKAQFSRVNGRYLSNDYRQYFRGNGDLKETQKSFICVETNNHYNTATLILNLSGRKAQYLSMFLLQTSIHILFQRLSPVLSCYLTQVTTPEYFNIDTKYLQNISSEFLAIFKDAGWFTEERFVKKRVRNFKDGGRLWQNQTFHSLS